MTITIFKSNVVSTHRKQIFPTLGSVNDVRTPRGNGESSSKCSAYAALHERNFSGSRLLHQNLDLVDPLPIVGRYSAFLRLKRHFVRTPCLTFTTAYICYPTPHLLPSRVDCVALILGLSHLARQPRDEGAKRWGRPLSTGPRTEKLPRWYYLVHEAQPPATCALVVDAGGDASEVDLFSLADVVDAGKEVYSNCLIEKGQVGLEFPGEGHIFVRLLRLDGHPRGLLGVDHMATGEKEVGECGK